MCKRVTRQAQRRRISWKMLICSYGNIRKQRTIELIMLEVVSPTLRTSWSGRSWSRGGADVKQAKRIWRCAGKNGIERPWKAAWSSSFFYLFEYHASFCTLIKSDSNLMLFAHSDSHLEANWNSLGISFRVVRWVVPRFSETAFAALFMMTTSNTCATPHIFLSVAGWPVEIWSAKYVPIIEYETRRW